MPKPRQEDRVKRWHERIAAGNKVYDRWAKRYDVDRLVNYYCGYQWRGTPEDEAQLKYVINMIFPTLETQQPSLMFYRPTVQIEPKPPYADDPMSMVAQRAQICQDTVQTFIDKREVNFSLHTTLGLRDAFFGFGLAEVGYTADWIDNPHAGKPVLDDQNEEMQDGEGAAIEQPGKIPQNEQLFVKRLDPRCFRVSLSSRNVLTDNDFVCYYEWHYVEDVKRNPKYRNTATLKASGQIKDMPQIEDELERERHAGMVKLWKVWDLRQKVKHVVVDGHDKFLLEGEAFAFLPLAALKFHELPSDWYPLPPVYNWMCPQDELNESREQQRNHRRRFERRYITEDGRLRDEELEKIEKGGDGTIAKALGSLANPPIMPVPDANLSGDVWNNLAATKEDFNTITGTSGEQKGVSSADTATQANIIDVRSRIRESQARVCVSNWLADICRLILLTLRANMQLPFWIQANADPLAQDPNEMMRVAQSYQEITAQDLGDGEMDVKVDITSLSPVTIDQQRQDWTQVLGLLTNPALVMIFAISEPLLRKTLKYYGIVAESEVKAIMQALQMMMMAQAQAQAATMAGPSGTPGAGQPAGKPAGMPASGGVAIQ